MYFFEVLGCETSEVFFPEAMTIESCVWVAARVNRGNQWVGMLIRRSMLTGRAWRNYGSPSSYPGGPE